MAFRVLFADTALRKLKKMDRPVAALIIGYIEKNLEGCLDPRQHGKPLTENHRGKWRYRIGDYRLLALIDDDKIIITVIDVGHRSDIYK